MASDEDREALRSVPEDSESEDAARDEVAPPTMTPEQMALYSMHRSVGRIERVIDSLKFWAELALWVLVGACVGWVIGSVLGALTRQART